MLVGRPRSTPPASLPRIPQCSAPRRDCINVLLACMLLANKLELTPLRGELIQKAKPVPSAATMVTTLKTNTRDPPVWQTGLRKPCPSNKLSNCGSSRQCTDSSRTVALTPHVFFSVQVSRRSGSTFRPGAWTMPTRSTSRLTVPLKTVQRHVCVAVATDSGSCGENCALVVGHRE